MDSGSAFYTPPPPPRIWVSRVTNKLLVTVLVCDVIWRPTMTRHETNDRTFEAHMTFGNGSPCYPRHSLPFTQGQACDRETPRARGCDRRLDVSWHGVAIGGGVPAGGAEL